MVANRDGVVTRHSVMVRGREEDPRNGEGVPVEEPATI